jgi:hypothetical protein
MAIINLPTTDKASARRAAAYPSRRMMHWTE